MQEKINRREFLKLLFGMVAGTTPAGRSLIERTNEKIDLDWLANPEDYKIVLRGGSELQNIRGGMVNSPFLWKRSNEERQHYIEQIRQVATNVRVFIDNSFEGNLGQYNDNVLARVKECAQQLQQNGMWMQTDNINGFDMSDYLNPMYGWGKASSPYAAEGINEFFGGKKYQEAYLRRTERICKVLKEIPNLTVVTLGNELVASNSAGGVALFMEWMDRMAGEVKNLMPEAIIAPGVADPRSIIRRVAGLDINTVHLYNFWDFWGMRRYLAESEIPVMVQEWGVPERMFGINYHLDLDGDREKFFRKIMRTASQVDQENKTVRVNLAGTGIWKIDAYYDSFDFDPDKMPKTTEMIQRFNFCESRAGVEPA